MEERDNMKNTRPQWMNDELFIIYENNNIKYWISDYKIEDDYNKWVKNKKIILYFYKSIFMCSYIFPIFCKWEIFTFNRIFWFNHFYDG